VLDTELTVPFWEACAESRLTVPECTACGRRWFVPEIWCPHCGSRDWEWTESPGLGSVYSFSTVYRGMTPDLAVPYVLIIVDLDDGWTMMSRLVNTGTDPVHIGMRVRPVYVAGPDERMLPCFEPDLAS
jgi:uncharacterized OB-fold protein